MKRNETLVSYHTIIKYISNANSPSPSASGARGQGIVHEGSRGGAEVCRKGGQAQADHARGVRQRLRVIGGWNLGFGAFDVTHSLLFSRVV